jgi:HEAT repeat protein
MKRQKELPARMMSRRASFEPVCHCAVPLRANISPLRFLCGVLLALVAGCGWLQRPVEFAIAPFREKPEVALAEMSSTPVDAAMLKTGDWVQAQPDGRLLLDPALPRFIHPGLEPLLRQPPAERANLLVALDHPEEPVRLNAAICLARWGDGRALQPCVAIVENVQHRLTTREAAAESLGYLTKPSPAPALGKLLDKFGRYEPSRLMDYSPELHADLLRALSRHVDAAHDTRFQEALRAPGVAARQEALAAWGRSSVPELPPAVVDLRADPNPQIRAAAIVMILTKRHPQALDFAKNSLQDADTEVRTATIAGLGRYGGPDALAMLERIMLSEGEVLRAAAVPALREAGALEKVWNAAGDKAWRVRRAVAEQLAMHPERRTSTLAYKFLADDSGEVRRAVVASLEAWPPQMAGPVLLAALKEPTFETRRLAGEQLARRWPPAAEFAADLPPERREQLAAELEARWSAEFGQVDTAMLVAAAAGSATPLLPGGYSLTPERLDQLQQLIDEASRGAALNLPALEGFGLEAIDGLERLVLERNVALPDAVYKQFLATRGAEFAALDLLTSQDVNDRRRAADRLEELAKESPPRPLVTARIARLVVAEQDGLVWRGLVAALDADATPAATTVALSALSHESPEVRRMGCELLAKRAAPEHVPVLLAAAQDAHVGTAAAAVKALAVPGMITDPAPLEKLLTSRNTTLRFETARTLHLNGFASGGAALERLAHDIDPEIRRRAAAAMAETGDRAFLPTLVALLNDPTLGVRKTTVDALVALNGTDISVKTGEPLPSLSERIRRWQAWYENQDAATAGR